MGIDFAAWFPILGQVAVIPPVVPDIVSGHNPSVDSTVERREREYARIRFNGAGSPKSGAAVSAWWVMKPAPGADGNKHAIDGVST